METGFAKRFSGPGLGLCAFSTTRTVDNHMASLRRKIELDPAQPRWVKTVHAVGCRLELPQSKMPLLWPVSDRATPWTEGLTIGRMETGHSVY